MKLEYSKNLVLILLILITFKSAKADPNWTWVTGTKSMLSSGLLFQNGNPGIDINIAIGHYGGIGEGRWVQLSGRIGFEYQFGFNENNGKLMPKIGAELNLFLISFRLNSVYLINVRGEKFALIPELGLCWGGKGNVMFGWNNVYGENAFRVSANYNLTFEEIEKLFKFSKNRK